jgi:PTS system cellobiose-specific IIC component
MGIKSDKIIGRITDLSNHRYVKAIQSGVMAMIGITIFAGVITLLKTPPFPADTTNGIGLGWMAFAKANAGWLNLVYQMTTGLYGLLALLGVVCTMAEENNINIKNAVIINLVIYLILSVNLVTADNRTTLDFSYLGSQGLFSAFFVGIFFCEILKLWDKKGPKIKLPEAVPPMVSAPFESLISTCVLLVLGIAIRLVCDQFGFMLPQLVGIILKPLLSASENLVAIVVMIALSRVLWFFGVHGTSIIMAVLSPVMAVNVVENLAAYEAGQALPHVLATGFISWQIGMLPAAIAMLLVCKSAQLKSISRLGIVPSIFMISEPILFGTPFIFNMELLIPHIGAFSFAVGAGYLLQSLNIVGRCFIATPSFMPGPLAMFFATLDWKAAVAYCIIVAVCVLIYLPFIKAYDKKLVDQESAGE